MYEDHHENVEFFLVYIREAHALDSGSPSAFTDSDGNVILDPINELERAAVASQCVQDLDLPMPALIDRLDDKVNQAYQALPDRLYLIGKDGKVAFAGERGPRGFDPELLEEAIVREIKSHQEPADGDK